MLLSEKNRIKILKMADTIFKDLFCELCSFLFEKRIDHDLHMRLVHQTNEVKLEIEDDVEKGPSSEKQKPNQMEMYFQKNVISSSAPIESVIEKNEPKITFSKCDERTKEHQNQPYKDSKLDYQPQLHGGEKPHKCSICDYRTSYKSTLKKHIEAVHEGLKQHKCPLCDYSASYTSHLKQHIEAVHEGKKPHKCTFCDISFARTTTLKKHIDAVHEKKKPHKCSMCDYRTSQKCHLKKHIAAIHEGKNPQKCSMCDYSTSYKPNLMKHIGAVHEGKKPIKCTLCNIEFTQTRSLTSHIATIHEGKKSHNCSICEYSCYKKNNLKMHIKAVHEENKQFETPKLTLSLERSFFQRPIESAHEQSYKTSLQAYQPQLPTTPLPLITATFSLNKQLSTIPQGFNQMQPLPQSALPCQPPQLQILSKRIETVHENDQSEITQLLTIPLMLNQLKPIPHTDFVPIPPRLENLAKRKVTVHGENQPEISSTCNTIRSDEQNLKQSTELPGNFKECKCHICSAGPFDKIGNLNQHMEMIHNKLPIFRNPDNIAKIN